MDDFSDRWVVSRVVRRYSDFVSYPIILKAEKDPEIEDLAKEKETGEKPVMPLEEKVLNSMKPIWTRPASEITQDRSEEHTSELQSRPHLVCRLLLEKKKQIESRYDCAE